ncbi:MAG: helix-turn-helix domain-containing protein [Actinobacteria bacterium]|nr:helix-turn-helix domain-containing protein [Actinomycetota bacterium]
MPSLLSVRQLSELLQIPVSTIYGWRYKREGPKASKVGRYLRFSTDDVLRWLENKAH